MSQWIMWEISNLFENIGTTQDGINTFSTVRTARDREGAPELKVTQGQLPFEQVHFHYDKGEGVLEDFNLTIKPGETIGLVGRAGAGQSALVNLLLRFYDVESGRILKIGRASCRE